MNAYDNLVKRINDGLKQGGIYSDDFVGTDKIDFDEVNPWTYWQGKGIRNPKIMVVGQEWGSINQLNGYVEDFKKIKAMSLDDKSVHCFDTNPITTFNSDVNMAKFFEQLGYPNVAGERYDDLFFTNLIPGFRKASKSTGGFKKSWITSQVKDDFKELLKILKPKVVLCLGRTIFEGVIEILGLQKVTMNSWNQYLDGEGKDAIEYIIGDKIVNILAMPHPGNYGTNNRGRVKAENDWERIGKYI